MQNTVTPLGVFGFTCHHPCRNLINTLPLCLSKSKKLVTLLTEFLMFKLPLQESSIYRLICLFVASHKWTWGTFWSKIVSTYSPSNFIQTMPTQSPHHLEGQHRPMQVVFSSNEAYVHGCVHIEIQYIKLSPEHIYKTMLPLFSKRLVAALMKLFPVAISGGGDASNMAHVSKISHHLQYICNRVYIPLVVLLGTLSD